MTGEGEGGLLDQEYRGEQSKWESLQSRLQAIPAVLQSPQITQHVEMINGASLASNLFQNQSKPQ